MKGSLRRFHEEFIRQVLGVADFQVECTSWRQQKGDEVKYNITLNNGRETEGTPCKKWDEFWSTTRISPLQTLRNTLLSGRWKKIEKRIKKHFGSFKGLNTVELGSGRGTESLLIALRGAKVTLVDFSEIALMKAREMFKPFGLSPNCYKADILNLDQNFFQKFDISMSFGTVEHFLHNPERKQSIKVHLEVLREGGASFISVPNKICPHYRLQSLRRVGENPFTPSELKKFARQVGFKYYEVFGSSLLDFGYLIDPADPLASYARVTTPLDNYFAYALILFAIR